MSRLDGKIALVTGGSSGIGYAIAKRLIDRGCKVIITGKNEATLKTAAEKLGAGWALADMENSYALQALSSQFNETGIDFLINNAGIAGAIPIENYTPEEHDIFFNTNVRGPLLLIKDMLPHLERRQGSIVTITSSIVEKGAAASFLYAATKGAVEAFTRSLAVELAPRGIRVNAVSPGPIDTPIFEKAGMTELQKETLLAKHRSTIPLGRRGKPEEVAHVVVAQLEAGFVTGAVWHVDGGYTTA